MSGFNGLIPARPAPPPVKAGLSSARVTGIFFLVMWFILGCALLWMVVSGWSQDKVIRYGPRYLDGLLTTVTLVGISAVLGAILSFPIAFARMSQNRVARGAAYAYIYLFRSTPMLAQLFLIYYGLGSFRGPLESVGLWWFFREAWYCGLLSLTLNTAAYQAEILRGSIESVPKGQREGAFAMGLPAHITFRKIILPQAMIVALRPYGNEIVLLLKGSAIVSIITVLDLMGQTRYAFSRSFDYQTYLWAAIFYLAIVELLRQVMAVIEARLTRHMVR